MTIKLNKRQLIAAEMLGMGHRPSSVAKARRFKETVSRWQQNENFDAAKSYLNTLRITNETTLIISAANQALLAALRDNVFHQPQKMCCALSIVLGIKTHLS